MTKDIADQFLRDITAPKRELSTQSCLIVVRSNRDLKRFIAEALSEVEELAALVKTAAPNWRSVEGGFRRLATLAREQAQHSVEAAALDISAVAESLDPSANGDVLLRRFSDLVTFVSTMLLRVYIEGNDHKCGWELESVRRLLGQCIERRVGAERRVVSVHLH
jgi:hypothetical protein